MGVSADVWAPSSMPEPRGTQDKVHWLSLVGTGGRAQQSRMFSNQLKGLANDLLSKD